MFEHKTTLDWPVKLLQQSNAGLSAIIQSVFLPSIPSVTDPVQRANYLCPLVFMRATTKLRHTHTSSHKTVFACIFCLCLLIVSV